jgi:hypothetical protein
VDNSLLENVLTFEEEKDAINYSLSEGVNLKKIDLIFLESFEKVGSFPQQTKMIDGAGFSGYLNEDIEIIINSSC